MQLSDTNIVVLDGDRGKNYPSPNELFNKGYCLFLSNKNIANHKLLTIDSTYITKEKHCALKQGSLTRNDVVLTTRGTVGNLLYVDSNFPLPCRINSGMVIIRSDETQFLQKYLFYYFQSPYVRNQIISLQTGSAQPQLPIKDIRQLEISLVPLDKQSHIVDSIEKEGKNAA